MIKTLTYLMCLSSIRCHNKTGLEPFVIKGELSTIEDFPHSAYLEYICGTRATVCGASVLNQRILVTAAHCLQKIGKCPGKERIKANFGNVNKKKGIVIEVSKYKLHENYSEIHLDCDIALVLLEKPVKLSRKVARVAIKKEAVRGGEIATIAGWGFLDDFNTQTNMLMHITQRIITRNKCLDILKKLPKGVFCARFKGQTVASGDSGSALVVESYIQVGVVSFGVPTHRYIVVYTDVAYHYKWIKENAAKLYCLP